MTQTRVKIGFQTRYKITAICSETEQPCSDTITIINQVLNRGTLALGDTVSYTDIALGTSSLPVDKTQTGLGNAVSTLPLSQGTFEQINEAPPEAPVTSTIKRTFVFKHFTFPSNLRTLDLCEVGLVGRTRAVFSALTIDPKTWVKVDLEIIYLYESAGSVQTPSTINAQETGLITYDITPIVLNQTPSNDTGKGYGRTAALRSYIYDGVNPLSTVYSNTLNPTIIGTMHYNDFYYSFHFSSDPFQNDATIPGFVVRDINNGIGFLVTYHQPLSILEDDSLDITVGFSWADLAETLPEPV